VRQALLPVLALLAGCHAHTGVAVGPGASASAPGASASVGFHAGPAAGALIGLGFVAAVIHGEDSPAMRAAPEPDPMRRVQEQDCTRPIADPAANLRCR
jgi:hypothetical protein